MNTEILSALSPLVIIMTIYGFISLNVICFIIPLIPAVLGQFIGISAEWYGSWIVDWVFTKKGQKTIFVVSLLAAPVIPFLVPNYELEKALRKYDETHFSSFSQRVSVSIPFVSDEKDRIAVKIDELMDLEKTLGSRKRSTLETVTAFEASISKRLAILPSLSQKGKDFEADLIGQERAYLAKAKKEIETLSDALTEVNYLKEYAKNRYAELGNDQAKTEIIGRIGGFTSKFR